MTQTAVPSLPTANQIVHEAKALRAATGEPIAPPQVAEILARVLTRWRDRKFAPRHATIAQISQHLGFSVPLLDESLDALLAPFTRDDLVQLAARVALRRDICCAGMARSGFKRRRQPRITR